MGIPLEVIYSNVGQLDLDFSLRYATTPTKAIIDDVQIVVRPISDKSTWDFKKLLDNSDTESIENAIT
jgi:hypothetical protein